MTDHATFEKYTRGGETGSDSKKTKKRKEKGILSIENEKKTQTGSKD